METMVDGHPCTVVLCTNPLRPTSYSHLLSFTPLAPPLRAPGIWKGLNSNYLASTLIIIIFIILSNCCCYLSARMKSWLFWLLAVWFYEWDIFHWCSALQGGVTRQCISFSVGGDEQNFWTNFDVTKNWRLTWWLSSVWFYCVDCFKLFPLFWGMSFTWFYCVDCFRFSFILV